MVLSAPVVSALGLLWMSLAGCGREPASLNAPSPPPPPSGNTGWLMGTAAIVVVALVALPFLYTLWTGQGKNEPVMHSRHRRRMTIGIASAVMATVIVLMMWILVRA
jgi:heme/copper-type cytochrome/quinol oxidase subunit 2